MSDQIQGASNSSTSGIPDFALSAFTLIPVEEKIEIQAEAISNLQANQSQTVSILTNLLTTLNGGQFQTRSSSGSQLLPARVAILAPPIRQSPDLRTFEPSAVPLHALVKFGAVFAFTLCAISIALWAANWTLIITPYAALLGCFISPFFYAMGVQIKKQTIIERQLSHANK
jgi:hypothetical protein